MCNLWLMSIGAALWVVIRFFSIGWPQFGAVNQHRLASATPSTTRPG